MRHSKGFEPATLSGHEGAGLPGFIAVESGEVAPESAALELVLKALF